MAEKILYIGSIEKIDLDPETPAAQQDTTKRPIADNPPPSFGISMHAGYSEK